jgi:hypothetical protein
VSIFQGGRHRGAEPEPPSLVECCDRCGAGGRVRIGKYIAVLDDQYGRPSVISRELDLVFCGHHFDGYQPTLAAGGWRVIEAARP